MTVDSFSPEKGFDFTSPVQFSRFTGGGCGQGTEREIDRKINNPQSTELVMKRNYAEQSNQKFQTNS